MKENMRSIAVAGVLSAAIFVSGMGGMTAFGGMWNGRSGDGYRCEAGSRDPDPVPSGDLGSMRAIGQNNAIDTNLPDRVRSFSYRTASRILLDDQFGSQGNINYSPAALYYSLALAAQGAGGNTRNQLMAVLGAGELEPGKLADGCGRLYRQMYRENEYTRVKLVNTMWLRDGNPIGDAFRRAAEGQYYSSVFRVDFANGAAPLIMKQWIADQTGQAVTARGDAAPADTMRLLNSMFFYNQWLHEFEEVPGGTGIFHGADGQEIPCRFMRDQGNSSYYKGQGFLRVTRSMWNNGTMIFVLPDEGVSVRELLSSEERTREMFGTVAESYGCVSWKAPAFDTATSLNLAPMLRQWGVTDALDARLADFTGINGEAFSLGGVVQETRFTMDARGVGPAFYTGEALKDKLPAVEPRVEMCLDRPFLYAVIAAPGIPVYMGVCNQPSA